MKVIKLNNRYRLFKLGYTHAILASNKENQWAEISRVENAARAVLGDQYANCWDQQLGTFNGPWTSGHFKGSSRRRTPLGTRFYVAVKREQDVSMILLKAQV